MDWVKDGAEKSSSLRRELLLDVAVDPHQGTLLSCPRRPRDVRQRAVGSLTGALSDSILALVEGIETGLSIMDATGISTWAGISACGIKALLLPPPPLASEVVICADNDDPGVRAAHEAAERWTAEGRTVRIALPPAGMDFNDLALDAEEKAA